MPHLANEATRSCAVLTLLGPLVSYTRTDADVTVEAAQRQIAVAKADAVASKRREATPPPGCVLQPQTALRKGEPPICIKLRPFPSNSPIGP
jgi:hypothetical protein